MIRAFRAALKRLAELMKPDNLKKLAPLLICLCALALEDALLALLLSKRGDLDGALFRALALGLAAAQIALCSYIYLRRILPIVNLRQQLRGLYEEIPEEDRGGRLNRRQDLPDMLQSVVRYQQALKNQKLLSQWVAKQSELNALQSQINPHFLFNTLESLRGYAYLHKQSEIAEIIESLSSLFRNCIQRVGILIPLSEELENVRHYVKIQQFRFANKFDFALRLPDDPEALKCMLPNLTIQPIVENSIFHGLERKSGHGLIEMRIETTQKRLIIRVIDNGVGISGRNLSELQIRLLDNASRDEWHFDDRHGTNDAGIGMLNIHKRIQFTFGSAYGISIASTLNVGTEVEITLPIVTDDKSGEANVKPCARS